MRWRVMTGRALWAWWRIEAKVRHKWSATVPTVGRVLTLAAVVSVVLGLAIAVLWVRSRGRWSDVVVVHARGTRYRLAARHYVVQWERVPWPSTGRYGISCFRWPESHFYGVTAYSWVREWRLPGLSVGAFGSWRSGVPPSIAVEASYWLLIAPCLPTPLAWFRRFRRIRSRPRHGQCLYCGYDLRATPWRCPECGRAPATR